MSELFQFLIGKVQHQHFRYFREYETFSVK